MFPIKYYNCKYTYNEALYSTHISICLIDIEYSFLLINLK